MMPHTDLLEEIEKLAPDDREKLTVVLSEKYLTKASPLSRNHDHIVKTPGICGGSARLVSTRIPVWTLVRLHQLGVSEADLLRSYPAIKATDLAHAWTYANLHEAEIEQDIAENEADDGEATSTWNSTYHDSTLACPQTLADKSLPAAR